MEIYKEIENYETSPKVKDEAKKRLTELTNAKGPR
jgi:hypothetical protein